MAKNKDFKRYLDQQLKDKTVREAFEEGLDELRIAVQLAQLREARQLSQSQLAARIESSQAVISRLENGNDGKISTLLKILNALDYEIKFEPK